MSITRRSSSHLKQQGTTPRTAPVLAQHHTKNLQQNHGVQLKLKTKPRRRRTRAQQQAQEEKDKLGS
jgi:hypothetical protein